MTNEYGIKLDRNGYAPSLLVSDRCMMCGCEGDLVRHEVFPGTANRVLSKRYGLWVTLCPACHMKVHEDREQDNRLRLKMQDIAERHYGWTDTDFIQKFGWSYRR